MRFGWLAAAAAMMAAMPSQAVTLADYRTANGPYGGLIGQSFRFTSGGQQSTIAFSFLNAITDVARGRLYIFSAPYLGTAEGLATTTSSTLLGSAAAVNNVYRFADNFTLSSNNYYYAYADTSLVVTWTSYDGYEPGSPAIGYAANAGSAFTASPGDFNFRLTAGENAGVPEPASWAMLLLGVGAIGGTARRRKRAVAHA